MLLLSALALREGARLRRSPDHCSLGRRAGVYEAAAAALAAARYDEANRLTEAVLRADPLREAAWRLAMRIANALGDEDGVIAGFRACERALAEIGTVPAASTRQLLESLRR
jgi:DNA-binding SARP family transcriptional activator